MKLIISVILTFFPAFIENSLRKMLLNQKIGKGTKIGFLAVVYAKKVIIGKNVKIKPFAIVKAEEIFIDDNSCIKSFSFISTRIIHFKKYVHIANFAFIRGPFMEKSKIEIGNHSRIFPFCWLDTNQTITIGNHVGIGGFTLIFTHGVWSNYFKGGPVTFKDVTIEDEVWLPWRVFVMPGVTIGKKSIIGANSLVNKNISSNSLAAGSPAKIIKENFLKELNKEELQSRLSNSINDFYNYLVFKKLIKNYNQNKKTGAFNSNNFNVYIKDFPIKIDRLTLEVINQNDYSNSINDDRLFVWNIFNDTIYFNKKDKIIFEFISFIRRYGVRLNIES